MFIVLAISGSVALGCNLFVYAALIPLFRITDTNLFQMLKLCDQGIELPLRKKW